MKANIQKKFPYLTDVNEYSSIEADTRFFAGDWGEVHSILPFVSSDEIAGYDIILMAETVYSISALPSLYELMKKVPLDVVFECPFYFQ